MLNLCARVIKALWPEPSPRDVLWAALSESDRIQDAGKALDRIDNHVRAYRRLLLSEAGFDADEFPFDPHGVKPVHPVDAAYQGGHRLVVEPIPVAEERPCPPPWWPRSKDPAGESTDQPPAGPPLKPNDLSRAAGCIRAWASDYLVEGSDGYRSLYELAERFDAAEAAVTP